MFSLLQEDEIDQYYDPDKWLDKHVPGWDQCWQYEFALHWMEQAFQRGALTKKGRYVVYVSQCGYTNIFFYKKLPKVNEALLKKWAKQDSVSCVEAYHIEKWVYPSNYRRYVARGFIDERGNIARSLAEIFSVRPPRNYKDYTRPKGIQRCRPCLKDIDSDRQNHFSGKSDCPHCWGTTLVLPVKLDWVWNYSDYGGANCVEFLENPGKVYGQYMFRYYPDPRDSRRWWELESKPDPLFPAEPVDFMEIPDDKLWQLDPGNGLQGRAGISSAGFCPHSSFEDYHFIGTKIPELGQEVQALKEKIEAKKRAEYKASRPDAAWADKYEYLAQVQLAEKQLKLYLRLLNE